MRREFLSNYILIIYLTNVGWKQKKTAQSAKEKKYKKFLVRNMKKKKIPETYCRYTMQL